MPDLHSRPLRPAQRPTIDEHFAEVRLPPFRRSSWLANIVHCLAWEVTERYGIQEVCHQMVDILALFICATEEQAQLIGDCSPEHLPSLADLSAQARVRAKDDDFNLNWLYEPPEEKPAHYWDEYIARLEAQLARAEACRLEVVKSGAEKPPHEMSIGELYGHLQPVTDLAALEAMHNAERSHQNRYRALILIEARMEELEGSETHKAATGRADEPSND